MSYASDIFNALSPVIGLVAGIGLGFQIAGFIMKRIGNLSVR